MDIKGEKYYFARCAQAEDCMSLEYDIKEANPKTEVEVMQERVALPLEEVAKLAEFPSFMTRLTMNHIVADHHMVVHC